MHGMPTTTNQGQRIDGDAPDDPHMRLVGTRVGKYEVVGVIGRGGMGCVYEALNTTIRKRVALKCIDHQLAKNAEAYERFHREALAASAIESPHIVQIFDAGKTDDGVPYIVMELLVGTDLGGLLKRLGRLDVADALHVTIHVLKGLHHAHAAGIVHRDLKPDNVFLVDREDDPAFIKLLDFGVSKISRANDVPLETLTRQGSVVGTPFYMSPEQAQAFPDVDSRTDIYSAGALLFECLAGRTPHLGKSYEQVIVNICMKDVDDIRTHNKAVPDAVAAVLHKALSREREDRYPTARDMLNALVDAAPESLRCATSSSKLRRLTLGDPAGSIAHTPLVLSPAPASRPPSGLADTVSLRQDGGEASALKASGVTPKSARRDTLPSDESDACNPTGTAQPVAEPSVSAPTIAVPGKPRRWALAAAPGIALLLGLALFVTFGKQGPADGDAPAVPAAQVHGTMPAAPVAQSKNQAAPLASALTEDASKEAGAPSDEAPVDPAEAHAAASAAAETTTSEASSAKPKLRPARPQPARAARPPRNNDAPPRAAAPPPQLDPAKRNPKAPALELQGPN